MFATMYTLSLYVYEQKRFIFVYQRLFSILLNVIRGLEQKV